MGIILYFAERRGNMLNSWCSEAMPPWFSLFLSSPALSRGVGKGRRKGIVSGYIWTTELKSQDMEI